MTCGYVNNIVGTIGYGLVDNTRVAIIRKICVEVLYTARKFTLDGFDYDLSKKFIPIGSYKVDTVLLNGTVVDNMNESMILQVYYIYLLSIEQAHTSGLAIMGLLVIILSNNILIFRLGYINEFHLYQ